MQLNLLWIFKQVVQAETLTRASRVTGIPKSTLSEKIAKLEKELKTTLLIRSPRKLVLTEAGIAYYKRVSVAISQIEAVEEETLQSKDTPQGTLRIIAPAGMATTEIPDAICRFQSDFPKIQTTLSFNYRDHDEYDLAIKINAPEDPSHFSKKIFLTRYILVASPKYLKRAGVPRRSKDLERHECILFSARSNHSEREWRLEDLEGRQQTVKTPKCIHVDNIDAIRRMATYGLGIALIPETKCREEIRNETLIHILPKLGSKPLPVQIVYPKQRFLARKIELVIPYIESALLKLANPSSFVSQ